MWPKGLPASCWHVVVVRKKKRNEKVKSSSKDNEDYQRSGPSSSSVVTEVTLFVEQSGMGGVTGSVSF